MHLKRHTLTAALLAAVTLMAPGMAAAAEPKAMPTAAPSEVKGEPAILTAAKVTREEAVALATKQFAIPAEMGEPNVSLSQNTGAAFWELSWRTPAKKPNPKNIMVMVNAVTGQVTHYSYNSAAAAEVPLSFSRNEALKKAEAWLDQLVTGQKTNLRYVDNPLQYGFYGGNASFQFHWDRMEQGYPVRGQGVDITIDARTGDLQNYTLNWQMDLQVEKPAALLEQAEAEAAYVNQLPMQMMYRYFQKPATDQGDWKLTYRPYGSQFPFVNQDGKLVNTWTGQPIDFAEFTETKLVPAAAKPYTQPAQPLTPEEALLLAQEVTGRKEAPNNMDCREEGETQKRQTCHFNWFDEVKGGSASVQIDMVTGLLIHYSNWSRSEQYSEKAEPKYSEEEARQTIIQFMQKYRPDLAGKALLAPPRKHENEVRKAAGDPIRSYNVSFSVTHEFVPVYGHEGFSEVDAMTGEIRYFSTYMQDVETEKFPALKDVIKGTEAIEIYLKQQGLELTWATFDGQSYLPKSQPGAKPYTTLVWAPRSVMNIEFLDAVTGVPYDYNGRDLIEAAKRPTDIEGHFAQREIELLWARGIFELKDGKFNPEQTVSAAELARWLVLSRGMQPYPMYDFSMALAGRGMAAENLAKSADAAYFGAALQNGILLPEDIEMDADPNAPVTRELYALWVVRALGYADIAKMESKIEMPFADKAAIGAKYANAAALLNGLKIISGDTAGNFNPQRLITRGEAAQMLFAVASKTRYR